MKHILRINFIELVQVRHWTIPPYWCFLPERVKVTWCTSATTATPPTTPNRAPTTNWISFETTSPPPHTTTSVYYEFMNIILGKYEFWGEMKKRNDGSEKMSPSHWINKSFVEMCRRINYQIEFQMGFYSSLIQSPASLDWIKDKNENKERLFR